MLKMKGWCYIKALTLFQPWATLIAIGAKKIETRSWRTEYRGPLAIHAALYDGFINMRSAKYICDKEPFYSILQNISWHDLPLPRAFVIAVCNLTACWEIGPLCPLEISDQERAFGDYTPGRFMWMLDDVQEKVSLHPYKGRQRLWEFYDELRRP